MVIEWSLARNGQCNADGLLSAIYQYAMWYAINGCSRAAATAMKRLILGLLIATVSSAGGHLFSWGPLNLWGLKSRGAVVTLP